MRKDNRTAAAKAEAKKKRPERFITPERGCTHLTADKVGRNASCPCGSGKKAKKCCGADTVYYSSK